MKNKKLVNAHVCAAAFASLFAFTLSSVSAADLASAPKLAADFRTIADSDLLALGPVDLVDPSKARVQVMGQWIPLAQAQISQNLEGLVGHVIAVYGSVSADGSLEVASVREQDSIDYVPGATHIYLKGPIAALDSLHGTARIGSLSVSYTNAMHSLAAEDLAVGTVVSFSGLRFNETNKLYADNALVHGAPNVVQTLGQTGSGLQTLGQTGSGFQTLGQTGSGLKIQGQTGSGSEARRVVGFRRAAKRVAVFKRLVKPEVASRPWAKRAAVFKRSAKPAVD